MDELSLEQSKAIALAKARLKMQQQVEPAPLPKEPAIPNANGAAPQEQSMGGKIWDFAKSVRGSPIAGGPLGMMAQQGMGALNEGLDKAAYATGGAATDALAGKVPPEIAAAGGTLANMGVQAIPTAAGALAGKMMEPATKPLARTLYQSALKPSSKDLASGDAAKAIETMLKGGYPASTGGVAKMRKVVSALSKDVDDMVSKSTGTVDKNMVRAELIDQLKKFRTQVNPKSDVSAILKSWDEFKKTVPSQIPVQQAQDLKRGTYKILADKYSHLGTVGDEAGTQAQMAMARGLRKGVEQNVPGVVAPNKKMADLINAIEIAERRAGIAGNRDLAGIAWLAENPVAGAGMLADRSPYVKSTLARLLYSGMPQTGAAVGTGVNAALTEPQRR